MTTKWSEIKRRKDPTGSSDTAENVARRDREFAIAEALAEFDRSDAMTIEFYKTAVPDFLRALDERGFTVARAEKATDGE